MRTREDVIDDLLVLAAQAGDVGAFERLAARWHPRLLRHARRMTGDSEGARDATQEAWVAIVRGLGRLQDPARFAPWALRITSRRCADWIARRRHARSHNAGRDPGSEGTLPTGPDADDLSSVRDAIRRLDRSDRLLLAMFYLEGYSVAEIAHACSVPPGTVKSRLFHARERVRAALEVSDGAEGRR
ncbi:MAG: sigma-70 family RNA polymerase sigma factor [Vicinamibacterales bacterium]|nr:sigma-70 family RNA polymerase sigma factor [Vicinamibacterales bacterium]